MQRLPICKLVSDATSAHKGARKWGPFGSVSQHSLVTEGAFVGGWVGGVEGTSYPGRSSCAQGHPCGWAEPKWLLTPTYVLARLQDNTQRPWPGPWVNVYRPDEFSPFYATTSTTLTQKLVMIFMALTMLMPSPTCQLEILCSLSLKEGWFWEGRRHLRDREGKAVHGVGKL